MDYKVLRNGVKMPQLGYGVFQISNDECERCVLDALKAGYRLIDTAQSYFNEEAVGNAISKSEIDRKDIFITTKIWIDNYGYEKCIDSLEKSLKKLQVEYIDLVLLHQPFSDYYGAWRALEEYYEKGKIRAIGVSNFLSDRLVDLHLFSKIKPMVNQIEIHPHYQQEHARYWNEKYNVAVEVWAPFGEGKGDLFNEPTLKEISKKYNKTTAQVMLRWNLQRGIIVIPKSTHYERIVENFNVFDFNLSEEDMNRISMLDKNTSSFFSHTDPKIVEWFGDLIVQRRQ